MSDIDLGKIQETIEAIRVENERLKEEVAKKDKEIVEIKANSAEMREKMKEVEPYLDIIEAEAKEEYWLPHIKDEFLYKQLKVKARQVNMDGGDIGAKWRMFIETLLREAINTHWTTTRARKFTPVYTVEDNQVSNVGG